jgi:hypothetical protein
MWIKSFPGPLDIVLQRKGMFMNRLSCTISTSLLFGALALASAAMAAPADHRNMNGNAMAGAQTATPLANDRDADDNNSNGRNATDRDKGLDRAEDRANAEGLEHGTAFQKDHDADDRRADRDTDKRKVDRDADRNDHDADDRSPAR